MKYRFGSMMILAAVLGLAAANPHPPGGSGKKAEAFIPKGWSLEHRENGYLNSDRYPDTVMLVRQGEGDARLLIILFGNQEGDYDLAVKNHTLIPGDSGANAVMEIKSRVLNIHLYRMSGKDAAEASRLTFGFRYGKGCFELKHFEKETMQGSTGETVKISADYGRNTYKKRTTRPGTLTRNVEGKLPGKAAPLCLEKIGSGYGFSPGL